MRTAAKIAEIETAIAQRDNVRQPSAIQSRDMVIVLRKFRAADVAPEASVTPL